MHGEIAGQKAEAMIAAHAVAIVEVDDLIAIVAGKKLHRVYLCKALGWGIKNACRARAQQAW
jgi:hypothetical protein